MSSICKCGKPTDGMYRGWYKKRVRYYKKMGASEKTN